MYTIDIYKFYCHKTEREIDMNGPRVIIKASEVLSLKVPNELRLCESVEGRDFSPYCVMSINHAVAILQEHAGMQYMGAHKRPTYPKYRAADQVQRMANEITRRASNNANKSSDDTHD